MTTKYTITSKMSNTGSIHDIASSDYDRDIIFKNGALYAVVLASYYGGKGYTTHKTKDAAIKKSSQLTRDGFSHAIIDTEGAQYDIKDNWHGKSLVKAI